jgi:hypothetical protein
LTAPNTIGGIRNAAFVFIQIASGANMPAIGASTITRAGISQVILPPAKRILGEYRPTNGLMIA